MKSDNYLFGKLARLVRSIQDFIVEDGEVKGQTKTDRMSWLHFVLSNVEGFLVRMLGLVDNGYNINGHKWILGHHKS